MRTARSMTSGEYFGCFFMGSILSNIGASTKPGAIHLACKYSTEELRSSLFGNERMPTEWFVEWLDQIRK
jgi:hypothetical protein